MLLFITVVMNRLQGITMSIFYSRKTLVRKYKLNKKNIQILNLFEGIFNLISNSLSIQQTKKCNEMDKIDYISLFNKLKSSKDEGR